MTLLTGLRIVEVSGNGTAAWTGKHFADWGAECVMLEVPGGSPLRRSGPFYVRNGEQRSANWTWLSRGKTLLKETGRQAALDAVAEADVLLLETELCESVFGLAPEAVRQTVEGKTITLFVSPFDLRGPYARYRATELGISAMGGWMSQLGDPRRQPVRPGFGPLPRVAGIFGFVALLVALRNQRMGGAPQCVRLSLQAVAASICTPGWLTKSITGGRSERMGDQWPLGVMRCKDGYAGVPPLTATHWDQLCHMTGIEDVLDHPEGRSPAYRLKHAAELSERVRPWLDARTRQEVFEEAQAWRLPSAPVQTIGERLECPHLAARGFWHQTDIDGATIKTPRVTYAIAGVDHAPRGPVRDVETVTWKPRQAAEQKRIRRDTAEAPYTGIRVLDLTQFWSGPYATMLLGALGADVIKIESIQRPDPYRYTLAQQGSPRWFERSPVWNDANCDKRSLTLDLNSPDGKALFERLLQHADIVISNFSNRVMPNLGLTKEHMLSLNERVIVVEMPGYGVGGPWEHYVGYAIAFEQLVTASMTGYADGPPLYAGGFCDPLVGMHTVAAIELALQRRERTGRGMAVEVAQCETLDSLLAPEAIAYQFGTDIGRRGNKADRMAPHDAYRVAGKDEWLTIAIGSDEEFSQLLQVLDQNEMMADARFATATERKRHEEALDALLSDWLLNKDGRELEQALQAAGVSACRIIKSYDLPEDPGLAHTGFFQRLTRAEISDQLFKTWPFFFETIDATHKRPAPLLGEHNDEILVGLLGLSIEDMQRLNGAGVIGQEPAGLADANY